MFDDSEETKRRQLAALERMQNFGEHDADAAGRADGGQTAGDGEGSFFEQMMRRQEQQRREQEQMAERARRLMAQQQRERAARRARARQERARRRAESDRRLREAGIPWPPSAVR